MTNAFRPRTLGLFVGDIASFIFALWVSLYVRAFTPPPTQLFFDHLEPFSLLFIAWVAVFFIAGLYESRSIILERRAISGALLVAQTLNIVIAALFFFFVPFFGIAPKVLLFIYAAVSFLFVMFWRTMLFPVLGLQKAENALVVGSGAEIEELAHAIESARHAPARIAEVIEATPQAPSLVEQAVKEHNPHFIIADFNNAQIASAFPELYNYLQRGIRFVDAMSLYEDVFGKVPLSVIDERWVARNVSRYSYTLYDSLKRVMDIVLALPTALLSLVLYPFIALAIKLEDGGPVFVSLSRVGEDNRTIQMWKFRSMNGNDQGDYGTSGESNLKVTVVGQFLRTTRLDELPQLWSILRGDLSFVGPRPETPTLVEVYGRDIPYYKVRHLIKPGLSGWAQLYHDNHPHHGTAVEATREKLSYDLYYVKHRSLMLDATIALKTLKKLITRSGV